MNQPLEGTPSISLLSWFRSLLFQSVFWSHFQLYCGEISGEGVEASKAPHHIDVIEEKKERIWRTRFAKKLYIASYWKIRLQ